MCERGPERVGVDRGDKMTEKGRKCCEPALDKSVDQEPGSFAIVCRKNKCGSLVMGLPSCSSLKLALAVAETTKVSENNL